MMRCRARQVAVSGGDRVLPLASFRGTTRPVLLAGSRAWLAKVQAAAEPYRAGAGPQFNGRFAFMLLISSSCTSILTMKSES